jgi:undecaprenyl-phosphate 4-deoxy-4-formamido-L-arabinose transferase
VSDTARPALSVVIPVFNEARSLGALHARLVRTLEKVGRPYEIIFVDDGSRDESADVLRALRARDAAVRMIRFTRNYGQHAALLAGMERTRGEIVVTLDADLQNPPEEIPRLLAALEDGADVVGGRRVSRRDPWARRAASWLVNRTTSAAVGVRLRDCGCMLRAHRRSVIDRMLAFPGSRRYMPVLAAAFASSMTEIPVGHNEREHGRSRYGPLRLLRLAFDLSVQVLAVRPAGLRVGRLYRERRRAPSYVIAEVLE